MFSCCSNDLLSFRTVKEASVKIGLEGSPFHLIPSQTLPKKGTMRLTKFSRLASDDAKPYI